MFDALMSSVIASVLALLPSVSENARNNAMIAIMSAICLFTPLACSVFSACSNFSWASMAHPSSETKSLRPHPTLPRFREGLGQVLRTGARDHHYAPNWSTIGSTHDDERWSAGSRTAAGGRGSGAPCSY